MNKSDIPVREFSQTEFEECVTGDVPDWSALLENPGFINWLSGTDPLKKTRRDDLLYAAIGRRDPIDVIIIFKKFKETFFQGNHLVGVHPFIRTENLKA